MWLAGLETHRVQIDGQIFPLATSQGSPYHHCTDTNHQAASCRHWQGPGEHLGVCFSLVLEQLTVPQGTEVGALLGRRRGSGLRA